MNARTRYCTSLRKLDHTAELQMDDCRAYLRITADTERTDSERRDYASLAISLARKVARYALRESALRMKDPVENLMYEQAFTWEGGYRS